ncbi:hypothetical protein PR048_033330 [Dryococelus australis]|uniref:Uncharacterized protein n=1 Tax=Dryococelus australis TaxID=614101 RepID=A0ABQ9FZZ0_9NEOP|nr:hypothetical protein PR048_033330 [Dryococelus australis]
MASRRAIARDRKVSRVQLDSTALCTLGPQMFVHWLLPQCYLTSGCKGFATRFLASLLLAQSRPGRLSRGGADGVGQEGKESSERSGTAWSRCTGTGSLCMGNGCANGRFPALLRAPDLLAARVAGSKVAAPRTLCSGEITTNIRRQNQRRRLIAPASGRQAIFRQDMGFTRACLRKGISGVARTRAHFSRVIRCHAHSRLVFPFIKAVFETTRLPPRLTGIDSRSGSLPFFFSHARPVSGYAAGRRVFSGISRFLHPCIPALLHTHVHFALIGPQRPRGKEAPKYLQSHSAKHPVPHTEQEVAVTDLSSDRNLQQVQNIDRQATAFMNANRVRFRRGRPPGFSHAGIVPCIAADRRVFPRACRFSSALCIPALLHTHLVSPSIGSKDLNISSRQNHSTLRSLMIHWSTRCLTPPGERRPNRRLPLRQQTTIVNSDFHCSGRGGGGGGCGCVVRMLASHLGEPGSSIPGQETPGFSQVGIVPYYGAGQLVFSGISRFPRPSIPALLHSRLFGSPLVDDRPIMNAVKYRVVSGVVWTNRTMVSYNTDTNRTGVLAVVDIGDSLLICLKCHHDGRTKFGCKPLDWETDERMTDGRMTDGREGAIVPTHELGTSRAKDWLAHRPIASWVVGEGRIRCFGNISDMFRNVFCGIAKFPEAVFLNATWNINERSLGTGIRKIREFNDLLARFHSPACARTSDLCPSAADIE